MENFDELFKTEGSGINVSKGVLNRLKKKPRSMFKKRLINYSLLGGLLYILAAVMYFTIFLITL